MRDLTIETVDVDSLHEYENNAKIHTGHQISQIIKSIQEFGFNDPLAIDEDNMIIEGHGRLYAATELGMKEVPCIRLTGLTDEQKRAYILVHNQLTLNTGFDPDRLREELEAIQTVDMTAFDLQLYDEEDEEPVDEEDDDIKSITLTLTTDQFDHIMSAADYIKDTVKNLHSYGNPNQKSNYINEVIHQWAERKKLL